MKAKKFNESEIKQESSKEIDKLGQENKKLERQRNELLTAYKKQNKLIDLLRKQKTHLEAARSLNFTEEEFIKAIDLHEKILN